MAAQVSHENESNYAGFLNGYIAGNLSANGTELQLHSDRIFSFISDLQVDVMEWNLQADKKSEFDKLFDSKNLKPTSKPLDTGYYLRLGNALVELVALMMQCKPELPSTTSFYLKKIIYHYLNIAKTLKDTNVSDGAKKLVEQFEG